MIRRLLLIIYHVNGLVEIQHKDSRLQPPTYILSTPHKSDSYNSANSFLINCLSNIWDICSVDQYWLGQDYVGWNEFEIS